MSERRARLEALLERVRSNATKPRTRAVSIPPLAAAAPAPISDTRPVSPPSAPDYDEADPVPLVRVASATSEASRDETPDISITPFSETGEVSVLDANESTAEDLSDADFEDMSSELLESLPPAGTVSWSTRPEAEELGDEPPISSQRPRILDQSLAGAEAAGDEREPPLMTPPPESGPQEAPAPAGLFAPAAPDVDTLIESVPLGSAASGFGPTLEQIGESVDLEEPAEASELELDEPAAHPATIPPKEELEALLDQQPMSGIYDDGLMPPPQAKQELAAHDRKQSPSGTPAAGEAAAPAFSNEPETQAFVSAASPSAGELRTPAETASAGPERYAAALPTGGAPEIRSSAPAFHPQSFLELLDASIALAG